ncbi:MAG TPA: hypothetical protein VH186_19135 [Chloroflexia bacterium]|nr:hypothetical protein [Chloroflexia bacterium]
MNLLALPAGKTLLVVFISLVLTFAPGNLDQTGVSRVSSATSTVRPVVSQTIAGQNNDNQNYLDKLFGNLNPISTGKSSRGGELSPLEWIIAALATLFYGQIALLVILWFLFTSDIIGIISGLVIIGLCLAFTLPRKPRRIGLFVLACMNFLLGGMIAIVVATSEGVYPVLISLIPLGLLVWLSLRNAFLRKGGLFKASSTH